MVTAVTLSGHAGTQIFPLTVSRYFSKDVTEIRPCLEMLKIEVV